MTDTDEDIELMHRVGTGATAAAAEADLLELMEDTA
jgi:hypothetical protein